MRGFARRGGVSVALSHIASLVRVGWAASHRGPRGADPHRHDRRRLQEHDTPGGRAVAPRPAERSSAVRSGPEPTRVPGPQELALPLAAAEQDAVAADPDVQAVSKRVEAHVACDHAAAHCQPGRLRGADAVAQGAQSSRPWSTARGSSRRSSTVHRSRVSRSVITFDDGYRDVLGKASPVLEHLRMPATAYVIADRISASDPSFLTWGNLHALEEIAGSARLAHGQPPGADAALGQTGSRRATQLATGLGAAAWTSRSNGFPIPPVARTRASSPSRALPVTCSR